MLKQAHYLYAALPVMWIDETTSQNQWRQKWLNRTIQLQQSSRMKTSFGCKTMQRKKTRVPGLISSTLVEKGLQVALVCFEPDTHVIVEACCELDWFSGNWFLHQVHGC